MAFTDEDLKRLREELPRGEMPDDEEGADLLFALIERLEAAEEVVRLLMKYSNDTEVVIPIREAVKAWRTAAGKDAK